MGFWGFGVLGGEESVEVDILAADVTSVVVNDEEVDVERYTAAG